MKRKLSIFLLMVCFLSSCTMREEFREPAVYTPVENCFLCGKREKEPWGQDNVGIVSLNTFDMMAIGINRYDGEGGFQVSGLEDPDRGYAMLTVTLGEDKRADRKKAAAFLCEACLERIVPEGREAVGLGVVNFATGEIRCLEKEITGFSLGDIYIHCDWEEKDGYVGLLLFYSPIRYKD